MALAAKFHPGWHNCSHSVRLLHARNGYQLLGIRLREPVSHVFCWTRDGAGGGGTGQAMRVARKLGIKIYDMGIPAVLSRIERFVLPIYAD